MAIFMTLRMVRLGFLSTFWGLFWYYMLYIYMLHYPTKFFVESSVRGLSYRHFKPSFSSLGQTSSESINFIYGYVRFFWAYFERNANLRQDRLRNLKIPPFYASSLELAPNQRLAPLQSLREGRGECRVSPRHYCGTGELGGGLEIFSKLDTSDQK